MANRIVTVDADHKFPPSVEARLKTVLTSGANAANGVFPAITGALEDGRSAAIQVQGDSTGDAQNEWVYRLGQMLGAAYPDACVLYKVWNEVAQSYVAGWSEIQHGAQGRRYAYFPPSSRTMYAYPSSIPAVTGDIDIRVHVALDNWQRGATQGLVSRYGSAGNMSFRFEIDSSNRLTFGWSPEGTSALSVIYTTALPFTPGQDAWLRATLDVDNGTGRTAVLYSSVDGVTWTQLVSSSIPGGQTAIFDPPAQAYEIGGRGLTGGIMQGKIFEVQIRDGIDGKIVNPQPIDSWIGRAATALPQGAGTFGGSPTLYIVNGSRSGADVPYLADATRHPKMVHPYVGALNFQSCSHNDSDARDVSYLAARDSWLAMTEARSPGSQVVILTQNPETAPRSPELIENHSKRRRMLMVWAARKGLATVDVYRAFLEDPRGLSVLLNADGLHPEPAGSDVWADTVMGAFN